MQEKMELDLKEVSHVLWNNKIRIGVVTIVVSFIAIMVNLFLIKPVYEAKVSIVVGQEQQNEYNQYSSDSVVMYQKLLKTYSEIAISESVVNNTMSDLNLKADYKEFKENIFVTAKSDTQILEIKIENTNPALAAKIANTLTSNFIEESSEILPIANMRLLDNASIPSDSIKPQKTLNTLVSAVLSFILYSTIILFKYFKNRKIKDEQDVEKYLGLNVVGSIFKM